MRVHLIKYTLPHSNALNDNERSINTWLSTLFVFRRFSGVQFYIFISCDSLMTFVILLALHFLSFILAQQFSSSCPNCYIILKMTSSGLRTFYTHYTAVSCVLYLLQLAILLQKKVFSLFCHLIKMKYRKKIFSASFYGALSVYHASLNCERRVWLGCKLYKDADLLENNGII